MVSYKMNQNNKIHKKHKEQDIISGIHNTLKPDGKIEGGTAFGYEVDIYYKIIREEISLL